MRRGDFAGAVDVFLQQQKKHVLTRILSVDLADRFHFYLRSRLQKELEAICHPDPLRALYIFLNLNGPRRHLFEHFEAIDQRRSEFQMPFNDSDFLEQITALPIESCLYHQFYVKWLELFPPAVLAVPWQAYPGHVPSTVPFRDDLPDQWTIATPETTAYWSAKKRNLIRQSAAMLSDSDFPYPVLRKSHLQLMHWGSRLKIGDYGYALMAALTYYRYWKLTGGKCEMPTRALSAGGI
jgi:hypothetical protein